jgi:hypothetical protein
MWAWRGGRCVLRAKLGLQKSLRIRVLQGHREKGGSGIGHYFHGNMESLPDSAYRGIPDCWTFRREEVRVGYCKVELSGVQSFIDILMIEPLCQSKN